MNKDTSTNLKWVIPAIIIVSVLVLAIALKHDELPYKLSSQEMLSEALNAENMVDKESLQKYVSGKFIFIDLRQPLEYNLSHPQDAINIPAEKILNEEFLHSIKDIEKEGNTIILYSSTPQKASGAWMLLKQTGVNNVRFFNGTFEQLISKEPVANSVYNEIPVIDTAILNKNIVTDKLSAPQQTNTQQKTVIPQRVKPAAESGGGC